MPDNRLTTLNAVHLSDTTKDWAEALNDNFAELDERKTDIGDTSTLVHDGSYVHTDNNFTDAYKAKLDNAEQNVQSDWNQSDSTADDYIKNKPENLVQDASYVHTDNNYTTAEKNKLAGVATGAQVNVLEGVKVNGTALTPTNKVVDVTVPTKDSDLATNDRYVRYDNATQALTDAQKSNARTNIGAGTVQSVGAEDGLEITGGASTTPIVGVDSAHKLPTTTEYNALATKTYVDTAIDNLPEPMVFKGTLGTGGTITTLPTAAASNEGFTYKVITAGTYASQTAKVGDVFVSNGSAWVLIPSGDDGEDTWRAINVNGTQLKGNGITSGAINFKNGGNITVTGSGSDITLGVASDYSIPSTTQQTAWTNKQDALDAQTAYSAKGTSTKVPQITTNSLGQVTGITEVDITYPEGLSKKLLVFTENDSRWGELTDGIYTLTINRTNTSWLTVGLIPIGCFDTNGNQVMATICQDYNIGVYEIKSDEKFSGTLWFI